MAKIFLKCFGVFGISSNFDKGLVEAKNIADLIDFLNECNRGKEKISFVKTMVYINGNHCNSKNTSLKDGDEVWLLSTTDGEPKPKPKSKKKKTAKAKKDDKKTV